MSKPDTLDLLRQLDPTSGDDPAGAVSETTRTELLSSITASDPFPARARTRRSRPVVRRLVPVLAAAAVIAAVAVTVVQLPGDSRQEALGPALSFTTEGKFLKVRIVDPEADSARFNQEFKDHGLDIKLRLVPSSPSAVGRHLAAVFSPGAKNIETTLYPAGCDAPPTYPCVPEFTIPLDYKGQAELAIGRAAKPGEKYTLAGQIDGKGEPLQGVKYGGMTVGAVVKILEQRGYTVPEYRVTTGRQTETRMAVPPTWIVGGAFALNSKQVVLFAAPPKR
ncbi:hypothetical protein ACGFIF_15485 [Kribbella sp. NPDC049174]|uniref:hypothetical protein n=1 Tax=Kribbella sp. NPDC049174 TaxID=3364112 RepID=UPI00371F9251